MPTGDGPVITQANRNRRAPADSAGQRITGEWGRRSPDRRRISPAARNPVAPCSLDVTCRPPQGGRALRTCCCAGTTTGLVGVRLRPQARLRLTPPADRFLTSTFQLSSRLSHKRPARHPHRRLPDRASGKPSHNSSKSGGSRVERGAHVTRRGSTVWKPTGATSMASGANRAMQCDRHEPGCTPSGSWVSENCRVAWDHHDRARGTVHAGLARRAQQCLDESAMAAALVSPACPTAQARASLAASEASTPTTILCSGFSCHRPYLASTRTAPLNESTMARTMTTPWSS